MGACKATSGYTKEKDFLSQELATANSSTQQRK